MLAYLSCPIDWLKGLEKIIPKPLSSQVKTWTMHVQCQRQAPGDGSWNSILGRDVKSSVGKHDLTRKRFHIDLLFWKTSCFLGFGLEIKPWVNDGVQPELDWHSLCCQGLHIATPVLGVLLGLWMWRLYVCIKRENAWKRRGRWQSIWEETKEIKFWSKWVRLP